MIKKILAGLAVVSAVASLSVGVASAHVVVKPAEVGVAARQSFTVGVPNEKEVPVVKVRLVVPDGVKSVTPNVMPGWTIDIAKDGTGESAVVKEITWSGGSIPAGQRVDFALSAQAPAKATTLQWKAYQTYEDGTEVAWDQAPDATGHDAEGGNTGPYSETKIVDDLSQDSTGTTTADTTTETQGNSRVNLAIVLSVVALLFSLLAYTSKAAQRKHIQKSEKE